MKHCIPFVHRTCFSAAVFTFLHMNVFADWPQWRGINRDGVSSDNHWAWNWSESGPTVLWRISLGPGCSSVTVSKGRVFAAGNKSDTDVIYCLNEKDGSVIWRHSYPAPLDPNMFEGGINTTPLVDGDRVFVLGRQGQLFCLNASDGKVVWSLDFRTEFGAQPPTWGYSGTPLIVDRMLIMDAGGPGSSVVALEKTTGKPIWKQGNDKAGYSSPVVFDHGGKKFVAVFNAFGLVIRELATGKEAARFPWKTSYDVNAATPIVKDSKIFIASGYSKGGALLQFDGESLKPLWQTKDMRNQFSSCVLWQGHLYGFDESTLTCLDFETGAEKWDQNGLGKATIFVADGKLVVLSEGGELVVAPASPDGFKPIARAKVLDGRCWVVPVLSNGLIFAKNNNGDLVCVDVSAR